MSLKKNLRELQDHVRDSGWRISWITWQETNRPEFVYNTPLTYATGCGGALIFIGSISSLFVMPDEILEKINEFANPIVLVLSIAFSGLLIAILGRLYAAWHKQSGWVKISATCIDQEVQKRKAKTGNHTFTDVWLCRLHCTFNYKGKNYEVTPETHHVVNFSSQEKAEQFLESSISNNGICSLFINPQNPLQANFVKKQLI
jgi:hypothetical protein